MLWGFVTPGPPPRKCRDWRFAPGHPTMPTGPGTPVRPAAPAYMGFTPYTPGPRQLPPVQDRFVGLPTGSSASNGAQLSRNPRSAAYAAQDVPNRYPY